MSNKNKTILSYVLLGVTLLICVMMFLPAIVHKNPTEHTWGPFSGTMVAFGNTQDLGFGTTLVIRMNFLAMLAFLLPLIVSSLIVVITSLKQIRVSQIAKIVLALTFILSIVGQFKILSTEFEYLNDVYTFAEYENYTLGAGPIIAAILAILGLAAVCFDLFTDVFRIKISRITFKDREW